MHQSKTTKRRQPYEYAANDAPGTKDAKGTGKGARRSSYHEDVEMLQDMVCAAVNEAIRNINEESNARLSAVTGGMGLPGMGGGMPGIPGLR